MRTRNPKNFVPSTSETAIVDPEAAIGRGVTIGPWVSIAAGAVIEDRAILHSHLYIPGSVTVGVEASVGPHCTFLCRPRRRQNRMPKRIPKTIVGKRAALEGCCTIECGVMIPAYAILRGGARLQESPEYRFQIWEGSPAELVGFACRCGKHTMMLTVKDSSFKRQGWPTENNEWFCSMCKTRNKDLYVRG